MMQTGMKLHIVIQIQGETCFEIGPLIPSDILFRNIHVESTIYIYIPQKKYF